MDSSDVVVLLPYLLGNLPTPGVVICGLDPGPSDLTGTRRAVGPLLTWDGGPGRLQPPRIARMVSEYRMGRLAIQWLCPRLDDALACEEARSWAELCTALGRLVDVVALIRDAEDYVEWPSLVRRSVRDAQSSDFALSLLCCTSPRVEAPSIADLSRRTAWQGADVRSPGPSRDIRVADGFGLAVDDVEDATLRLVRLLEKGIDAACPTGITRIFSNHHIRDVALLVGLGAIPASSVIDYSDIDVGESLALAMKQPPDVESIVRVGRTMTDLGNLRDVGADQAYAIAAYLMWWLGSGGNAARLAGVARRINGTNTLAMLVEDAVVAGLAPPWYRGAT